MRFSAIDRVTVDSRIMIAVLNSNSAYETVECLESLLDSTYHNFAIMVVDNGSKDDSVARLFAWAADPRDKPPGFRYYAASGLNDGSDLPDGCPSLCIIETGKNAGFSGGNNIAIRWALQRGAPYILLLNNDTVVEADFLGKLLEGVEPTRAAIAGCAIYEYDCRDRVWFAGGRFRWWRSHMVKDWPARNRPETPFDTDWVTGCCMLVRRDVFENIGLLDERAFLYGEDVDFCWRAAKSGFRRVVVPQAKIYHKVGASVRRDSAMGLYHFSKSRLYFHRKHHSTASHLVFLTLYLCSRIIKCLAWARRGRVDLIQATIRAVASAYGNPEVGCRLDSGRM